MPSEEAVKDAATSTTSVRSVAKTSTLPDAITVARPPILAVTLLLTKRRPTLAPTEKSGPMVTTPVIGMRRLSLSACTLTSVAVTLVGSAAWPREADVS